MHERHAAAAWEIAPEVGEGRRVGAREAVDRLGGVADDAEIGPFSQPRAQQTQLQRRRILEFVDEKVAEAPLLRRREFGVALEGVGRACQQVVEVEEVALALLQFVALVQRGNFGGRPRQPPVRGACRRDELLGRHHACLRPLDFGGDVGRGDGRPLT